MADSDNVQLLRRLYTTWDAKDVDGVLALLDPEVEWVNPDYAVEPGTRRGHAGFSTVMSNLNASFEDYSHLLGDFVEVGDRLLWHTVFRARGHSGAQVDIPEQHLWTMRDGKVLRLQWFHDVAEAEQAAADAAEADTTKPLDR